MIVSDAPSPNFGLRAQGKMPRLLVLHYTDTPTGFDALKILQDPEKQVSAHYLVDEHAAVFRLVQEDMRAWHAGKSSWEGEEDVNSISIGIEIQNKGHSFGYDAFDARQIVAVAELCRGIIARHGILPHHVLGHSDIAPGRKIDPGHLFPWQQLASSGIGIWPAANDHDRAQAAEIADDQDAVRDLLIRFGYDARIETPVLLKEFQRHFVPESFTSETDPLLTLERLCAAMRLKLAGRRKS